MDFRHPEDLLLRDRKGWFIRGPRKSRDWKNEERWWREDMYLRVTELDEIADLLPIPKV